MWGWLRRATASASRRKRSSSCGPAGSRQDHLQGDQALQGPLACLVHHAHAAAAQLAQDLVTGDGWQLRLRRGAGQDRRRLRRFGSVRAGQERVRRTAGGVAAIEVSRGQRRSGWRSPETPPRRRPGFRRPRRGNGPRIRPRRAARPGRGGTARPPAPVRAAAPSVPAPPRRKEVLDPGPAAVLPGDFKLGTHPVQALGEDWPQLGGGRRVRFVHRGISCCHSVRIKRILRLIVRAT